MGVHSSQEIVPRCLTSRPRPPTSSRGSPQSAHLDVDRLVIDDEAAFRDAGIRDLAWTAAFSTDEATTAAAQWLVWEASQALGARSASIQGLYEARARGEVHGFTVPAINIRAQTFDMARTVYEAAEAADVGAVILELARSEQTYTFQRPIDYATAVLAGRDRRGLAASGLHPGRPLPVQRQEVRRRSGEDDRGDPARLPAGDRRRLSQHRHRLVHARRPVEAERRRGAARELRPRGGADRADPVARARTASRSASVARSARSGSQNSTVAELRAYLDGYRRELDARAPGAKGHLQGQRPDRHVARWRAAARRRRGRGQARLRGAPRARRGRPLLRAGRRRPARRVDAARRAVPPVPGGRDRRDPPRHRVPERALRAPGLPGRGSTRRSRRGASPTPRTSARPARPISSSSTRRARRRSGRSSASCGSSRRRTRSWPRSVARSRTCSPSSG